MGLLVTRLRSKIGCMTRHRHWPRVFSVLTALLTLCSAGLFLLFNGLRGSRPRLDGELRLPGLEAPVMVVRDARGVPAIQAENRMDAARALGFLHAQERSFQMELTARAAAGELSEVFGPLVLELDKSRRLHRPREIVRRSLEAMPPADRALLDAYCEGVNAGRAAQLCQPFEFWIPGLHAREWTPEDCLLVGIAMYFDLQGHNMLDDLHQWRAAQVLSPQVHAFFMQEGGPWQAAVDGGTLPNLSIPPPEAFAYLEDAAPPAPATAANRPTGWAAALAASLFDPGTRRDTGSNAWAVSARKGMGRALVANDMHLGLRMPNTWFHAQMEFPGTDGELVRMVGVTLPGLPLIVAGSNGHVAWGFTNSYLDTADIVQLDPVGDPAANRYRTPRGATTMRTVTEEIAVAGQSPVKLEIEETTFGPVAATVDGHRFVVDWIGRLGLDMGLRRMEEARSLEEALDVAARAMIPAQNCVVATGNGRIGWTIAGVLPDREGYASALPVLSRRRFGPMERLPAGEHPRVVDAPSGYIATANARTLSGSDFNRFGAGGFTEYPRQWQIARRLDALDTCDEADMVAIQMDNEAVFLHRWQALLLEVLSWPGTGDLEDMRTLIAAWDGHADPDSAAYTVIRSFRQGVMKDFADRLLGPVKARYPDFDTSTMRLDQPFHQIATERPGWLRPGGRRIEALLVDVARTTRDELAASADSLDAATWGQRNRLRMQHPLAMALPPLSGWLDSGRFPLGGDMYVPRVAIGGFGASERFVVSPGDEERGTFMMPGGQSGHPMSPNYRDGTKSWVDGRPGPLVSGPPVHLLVLRP